MKKHELKRLIQIEKEIKKIAVEECGLLTTDIVFEVVPARKMIEAMAYQFPVNFSHWSFGRDYDRHRTIYEHTGVGIPYEQVWNFEIPKALLVDTNPLPLNVLVIAHVYGHVDYFLGNRYLQHGRSFSDIAEEARYAATRFKEYEVRFGIEWVEKVIEAGMALQWHQPLDPFLEEPREEDARAYLMKLEKEKMRYVQTHAVSSNKKKTEQELRRLEAQLKILAHKTPPEPVYDILQYIIKHAPRLKEEERDILTVIRNQARALAPNRRTKLLDEGWATYWHTRIMRRLFEKGLLSAEEHGVFLDYHAKVTQASKRQFNVYNIGPALFEYIKERWDRGQFGKEYEECRNPFERNRWDTKVNRGTEKIFEVRSSYTDRMAAEEFFTPDFIRACELYIYEDRQDGLGNIVSVVVEKRPAEVQKIFKRIYALYGTPQICVIDGNYKDKGFLYLAHKPFGDGELDQTYRKGALEYVYACWKRPVFLETQIGKDVVVCSFDGTKHKIVPK
ncbi:MAG: SpoVR family protein [Parcubacteria group bacterium]|nr:SpoVR family protein [Candidatus Wildermuthbacteria bacterium]MBI2108943.1 SpoVR family protein [Parcubacteria group bacterium]